MQDVKRFVAGLQRYFKQEAVKTDLYKNWNVKTFFELQSLKRKQQHKQDDFLKNIKPKYVT